MINADKELIENIQNHIVRLIGQNPCGNRLCLIGGFRLRYLDNSCRFSNDIDYHWEDDLEKKQKLKQEECDREEKRLLEVEKDARERLTTLRAQRDAVTADIDNGLLHRYERLCSQYPGTSIAPVRNGNCGGCFIRVLPRTLQEIERPGSVVECTSCHRLLYIPQA